MIESQFVYDLFSIVLVILVVLLVLATWRVVVGPTPADRLQAIDAITNVLVGIIMILALTQSLAELTDLAIALALFSFVATSSIARYLSEGRMF